MAKNKNIQMPSSGAGLIGMSGEDSGSKFHIKPQVVFAIIIVITIVIMILNYIM